jgi:hypothetical protein
MHNRVKVYTDGGPPFLLHWTCMWYSFNIASRVPDSLQLGMGLEMRLHAAC